MKILILKKFRYPGFQTYDPNPRAQDVFSLYPWWTSLMFLFCSENGVSDNRPYLITSPCVWEEFWRLKSLLKVYQHSAAWATVSFHQPNHITFKTVSLSSLWFYLIYCTWNLISCWLAFAFFRILVIHILSFSFQSFESSSYSWRKAALVFYPVNTSKRSQSQTQG